MRRRDAVARVAKGEVHLAGRQRPDHRQVRGGDVDRPAPPIDDGHLGPAREEQSEAFGSLPDRLAVVRERLSDTRSGAAAAAAEGDPAVARRPEIAQ